MENWNGEKTSGENKNKLRKMYTNNHDKFYKQQVYGPILLALIEKRVYCNHHYHKRLVPKLINI